MKTSKDRLENIAKEEELGIVRNLSEDFNMSGCVCVRVCVCVCGCDV